MYPTPDTIFQAVWQDFMMSIETSSSPVDPIY